MRKTLIISEKPDAALHLAEALNVSKKLIESRKYGMPYFEIETKLGKAMVCSASGHLYKVDSKGDEKRNHYPIWDFTWKPKYLVERNQKRQEKWIKAIYEVSRECDKFINACDYDIEGSLIGYTVLKYACKNADRKAKRMKYSALTRRELQEAFQNLSPHLNIPLVNAGRCRHEVDWIYGINLTRALTELARQHSKKYFILSTGRVQGPTLKFIVEREKEILTFAPLPYWTIGASIEVNGNLIDVEYEKDRIEKKEEADEVVKNSSGKYGKVVDLEIKECRLPSPTPFDISELQSEAYRHFRNNPRQTLGIAERLYLDTLISYPRTSSQKLPYSIGYIEILDKLSRIKEYEKLCKKLLLKKQLKPHDGKKTDPAHPAIYPTGVALSRKLTPGEKKIYDLIVKRFLATFGETALKQNNKVTIKAAGKKFHIRGSRILEKGWIEYYEPFSKFDEVLLPRLSVGERIKFVKVVAEEKFTKPPPRYNPSSLLKLMEKENIGTKATRANIVDILFRRGYIKGERMIATPLAFKINEVLSKYCPKVTEVSFTREIENMMNGIEFGVEKRETVLVRAIENLKPVIESLREKESEIGKELSESIRQMKRNEITLNIHCPNCDSKLFIVRSKKTHKRFIGCSGMWAKKCKFSLPLPQIGALTLMKKYCNAPECGFQMIQVKIKKRRPMVSCPRCYINKGNESIKNEKIDNTSAR